MEDPDLFHQRYPPPVVIHEIQQAPQLLAAARVGQLLNVSDIARDVGIAVSTAAGWLHALEATGIIFLLRPYFVPIPKPLPSENWGGAGPLFETYCVKEKKEVDLLIAQDGLLFPVEIKLTASPARGDIRSIEALRRAGAPLGHGAVVCLVDQPVPLSNEIDALRASTVQ